MSVNATCPCGHGDKYKRCCFAVHRGRPGSPSAVMRARYAAYALGKVSFLVESTHASSPHRQVDLHRWRQELHDYCRHTTFLGLEVLSEEIAPDEARAWVTFVARMCTTGMAPSEQRERSLFLREGRRWKYVRDDPV